MNSSRRARASLTSSVRRRSCPFFFWPPMPSTVDPLLPLSLFEAVRSVDRPRDELETELVEELRNKRLGLSDTVFAQIKRYAEAVKRKQRPPVDEVVALAKLIGRRPDAEEVYREGGRILARQAYQTISPFTRRMMLSLPSLLARPIALRHARRITRRYAAGVVRRVGSAVLLEVRESVTVDAAPRLAGCAYYESALRELLQLLVGGVGAVDHVRCASRGEGTCEWRAEWRPIGKNAR
jgi:predicted hydrocarbon binding protein